jgi:hypothetical protein
LADIVLVPGDRPVPTTEPTVNVAPMRQPGVYIFTVVVEDDAGLTGSASLVVTVRLL